MCKLPYFNDFTAYCLTLSLAVTMFLAEVPSRLWCIQNVLLNHDVLAFRSYSTTAGWSVATFFTSSVDILYNVSETASWCCSLLNLRASIIESPGEQYHMSPLEVLVRNIVSANCRLVLLQLFRCHRFPYNWPFSNKLDRKNSVFNHVLPIHVRAYLRDGTY